MKNEKALRIGEGFECHAGKVMAKFRRLKGYTQDNVDDELGVSGRTIGKYEKAKLPVTASTMAAVSQICDFEMIEYILFDNLPLAQKFKSIVKSGRISPYGPALGHALRKDLDDIVDMDMMRQSDSYPIRKRRDKTNTGKKDILFDYPPMHPLPICDEDDELFLEYMSGSGRKDRLRVLLYGYGLLKIYTETGSPRRSTTSLARQLLKLIIKERGGSIDQNVYDYYWKCVYYQ
ncbi:MAG: helix-turn-helix domain-containing protein [Lachnospiraceae bacterium]|nr:helix-turn-helix domain-containing protein [Lachnospiraceae bacterium]